MGRLSTTECTYLPTFNTSILEAHYLWERVHISPILACTYLWDLEEQKYE